MMAAFDLTILAVLPQGSRLTLWIPPFTWPRFRDIYILVEYYGYLSEEGLDPLSESFDNSLSAPVRLAP
jgi:hypothetical protein